MAGIDDGIHTVRVARQSTEHPRKDTVILEGGGIPFFRTDHGEVAAGDRVRVEDGRYAGRVMEDA